MDREEDSWKLTDHGRRLTRSEYERRIVALHSSGKPLPSREEDAGLRRAELDLLIDYRLGVDFPEDRRRRLLEEQLRLDRRLPRRLLLSLVTHPLRPSFGLARSQVRAYARHLLDQELADLLGLSGEELDRLKR